MAKEYAIADAKLSCEYGSQPSQLKVPGNRHITVDGSGFGHEGDISKFCLGCFGSCSSPYVLGENTQISQMFTHIQEVRASTRIGQEPCKVDVEIPWQNSKPDVYAAKCKALLEDGWTVCHKGYGIISVIDSGQNPGAMNQKILEKLQELEEAVDQYMKDNHIPEKHRDDLIASILLWNGNEYNPWKRKSNDMTRDFNEYLKKDNPALYNFFEREIHITDSTGSKVDLNYFIGITNGVRDTVYVEDYYHPTTIFEPEKFHAYIDAHNVEEAYHDEMKDLSWSQLINQYYNLDGRGVSKADSRYHDYVHCFTDEQINTSPVYSNLDMSDEEKKIELKKNQVFSQWTIYYEEEEINYASELFKNRLAEGLEAERERE